MIAQHIHNHYVMSVKALALIIVTSIASFMIIHAGLTLSVKVGHATKPAGKPVIQARCSRPEF